MQYFPPAYSVLGLCVPPHLFSRAADGTCPICRGGDSGGDESENRWLTGSSTFPLRRCKLYRVPSASIRATKDFFLRRNAAVPKATPTLLANSTTPEPTAWRTNDPVPSRSPFAA